MSDLTLAELVEQLAVRTFDGHGHNGDSLLQQLLDARYSGIGRHAGDARIRAQAGGPNFAAITMLEDVWGRIQSMTRDWTEVAAAGSPQLDLLAWWASFTAANERGEVKPHHEHAATTWLTEWVERINDLVAPAHTIPLRGSACPDCGADRVAQGEGELYTEVHALQVRIEPGRELQAECLACHTRWIGTPAVIALAKEIGARLDSDRIREAIARDTPTTCVDNHMDATA